MGALLTTVVKMMSEIVAFLAPATILLCGFSTTFYAIFGGGDYGEYTTFWISWVTLYGFM